MSQPDKESNDQQSPQQTLSLDQALKFAMRLHQANELESAEIIYRKLLEVNPEEPNLLHFFGMLRNQRGFAKEAVEWIKKSLNLVPDYIDAENNLANIYLQLGLHELAETHFRHVIETNQEFAAVYANLAIALKKQGREAEAVGYMQKAVDLEPDTQSHYLNLGNIYHSQKKFTKAVSAYQKAITMQPSDSKAYQRISRTYYQMGKIDCCIQVLQQWLDVMPGNPTALHLLAAYTHTNTPARASDAYVQETFDGFAASFNGVLKVLNYQAPSLIHEALAALSPNPENWVLLDAGCGTGLFGILARPQVKQLVGIDLSGKMLAQAEATGVYDQLIQAELTAFFYQADAVYTAITCVDTFCYFGDLTEAINAAKRALKPDGWLLFTVEKLHAMSAVENFQLTIHGRYSHTEAYVRKLLLDAGYQIHCIKSALLRTECAEPVLGLVITARYV